MTSSRVLVVSPKFLPEYAGWLQQTLTMIQACNPEKITFTWICPRINGQPGVEKIYENLTVRRIGSLFRSGGRLARVAFGLVAARYLLQNRATYDVVYCPWAYTPTDLVTLIAMLLNRPAVVRVAQGELSRDHLGGRIRRWLFKQAATALIVLNRHLYHDLGESTRAELHCFFNGVDHHRFSPCLPELKIGIRQQRNLSTEQQVILFVGSITPRKGVDMLVAAFARLVETNQRCLLLLAGPIDSLDGLGELRGSFVNCLQHTIQQQELTSKVHFLGRVDDVSTLLRTADIFVLPSLAEGMPNVLLEAMATGLPCVATDIPGIQELITDNVNGLLFSPGDIQSLADNLKRVLDDPTERHRLGSNARQTIESQFSIEKTSQNYQVLFLKLASRGNDAN